jgi:hypothetical protein
MGYIVCVQFGPYVIEVSVGVLSGVRGMYSGLY